MLSFTFTSRFVDYICVYVYSGVTSVYVFALESIKPMLYVCVRACFVITISSSRPRMLNNVSIYR